MTRPTDLLTNPRNPMTELRTSITGSNVRRRLLIVLTGTSLFLWAACAPQATTDVGEAPDMQLLVQTLIEADEAFNAATQELGAAGWASSFDNSGAMIQAGVGEISGLDAIYSAMDVVLSEPGASLTWEPRWAHSSDDGTLGFTMGDYESTGADENGENVLTYGLYVSIWRRKPDGSWRVLMDLGNPTD
jgi:ketosteroid isomerase-like protein